MKKLLEAREMAVSKVLVANHEEPSSDPQYPHKKLSAVLSSWNHNTGELEMGGFVGNLWLTSLAKSASSRFSQLCSPKMKGRKQLRKTADVNFCPPNIWVHTHTAKLFQSWYWNVLKEDANFLLLMIRLSRIYLSYASAFCIWTSSKLKISEDSSSEN